jgi:hypothetical protein
MGKPGRYIWLILVVFWALIGSKKAMAQVGVFSKGVWGKVGVTARGVYKIDMAALNSMGLVPSGGVTPSDKIRLFGSGGAMLPEAVGEQRPSAFTENALLINDGGDGILSGQDFIVFYAPGPHRWHYNGNNNQYNYEQNLYSDTAFYFLNVDGNLGGNVGGSTSGTIGAAAKRVGTGNAAYLNATAGLRVTSFTDNWVYEKENINVFASGKLWLGDAFSMATGGTTTRNYVVDMPGLISTDSVTLKMYAAARSIGVPANFAVRVNNNLVQNVTLPAVSGGFLDTYASYVSSQSKFIASTGALQLNVQFSAGGGSGVGFGAEGFLDKIECSATKALSMSSASSGSALFFRSGPVVSAAPAAFLLSAGGVQNFANTTVLDITDIAMPKKMEGSFSGGGSSDFVFINDVSFAREYVAFTPSQILVPALFSAAPNNNLHALALDTAANYLIITHPSLLTAANKLAQFHTAQKAGIKPLVVTTTQMYQGFGSGSPDITAIRDGVAFFARAYGALSGGAGVVGSAQKEFYVLLLGASSYDYKNRINNNVNLVPGYQSSASLDPLSSYTSDDYFALLDSSANINIEPLLTNINATNTGVNIGRIPAKNVSEANTVIDKIINYHSAQSQGLWRMQQRFIADDKDFNLHVQDAEAVSSAAQNANALFNQQKIYLDAYPLVSGSGGGRYPAVNEALVNAFNSGSLVINYSGHGNYLRLADEAIFSSTEIPLINNANKLPLVITASCDFYPYDDPTKKSLGQQLLFGAGNVGAGSVGVGAGGSSAGASGAIALLTTPRLVFAYSNKIINENYFVAAHKPDANTGLLQTLGEAVKNAKNLTVQQSRDFINARKFALLGDPAMRLAYPNSSIVLDSVNGKTIGANDTLVSGKLYTFKGSVMAPRSGAITGSVNSNFNGTLYFTLYDKQITRTTLKNDPATAAANYHAQENILYAGLVSVANGKFTVSFVLPLDISYAPGKAKISMYAQQTINPASPTQTLPDAAGVDTSFYTMGSGAVITDKVGPVIDLFLNDYNFKNGGLTHSDPVLLINLQDVSGINTSSSAIGHDIIVTLDNNPSTTRTLNSFYQANINTYQYGTVRYQLPTLTPGPHTLQVRAWDNVNNSNTRTLGFTVAATAGSSGTAGATGGGIGGVGTSSDMSPLVIDKVINFPNPFTSQTTFSFEHNFPGQNIEVNLSIYTQNGKLVKQINKTANTNGTRNVQITWDGTDAAGSKIARNVYIYKIQISAAGTNYQSSGKLICL